jgi:hypothetical protein
LEVPVFQNLNEAKVYCHNHSREEKQHLLQTYSNHKDLIQDTYQVWGAPSDYYLRPMLFCLYEIDQAYSRYNELTLLEKHGLAHLVLTLTSPYCEACKGIELARPKNPPINKVAYRVVTPTESKLKIRIYDTRTGEYKAENWVTDEAGLQKKLENLLDCKDILISSAAVKDIDWNRVTYCGNYIHDKIKDLIGHENEWNAIRWHRNRLAHPNHVTSWKNLEDACELLCDTSFIEDMEAVTFLLSPLTPEELQQFCDTGKHPWQSATRGILSGWFYKNSDCHNAYR